MKHTVTLSILLGVLVLGFGCARLKSTTERTTTINPTNNVVTVTEKTRATGYTLFDANASLVKFSNRSGYTTNGTFGPGTYASGVNESSSTSNLTSIISAVAQGVVQGLK